MPESSGASEPFFKILRRVIADLFKGENHLQNQALPRKIFFRAFNGFQRGFDGIFVNRGLFFGQRAKLVVFDFVGQIGNDRFIGFQAAQQKRRGRFFESFECLMVFFVLNRFGEIFMKFLERAEISAIGEIHNAPVFRKAIFDRRSAHRDKGFRFQGFNRFGLRRRGIFDVLRFVHDDGEPFRFFEFIQRRCE